MDGKDFGSTNSLYTAGTQIYYNGKLVAYIVIYGDPDGSGVCNFNDRNFIDYYLNKYRTVNNEGQKISADIDHNGIVDDNDIDLVTLKTQNNYTIDQKVYASIPMVKWKPKN